MTARPFGESDATAAPQNDEDKLATYLREAGPRFRTGTIVLWVLRILMAALFLFGAVMKLTSQPMMIQEFDIVGLGQWFRYFTGALELVGAVAILVPSVSPFGAIALLLVDLGAFIAQVSVIHMDWIHTFVVALILCAVIYLQRDQIQRQLNG